MSLNRHLRQNPADLAQRTFLFELLCFSGQYDRAEKQLELLARRNPEAEMGAALYRAALHAERARHETYRKQELQQAGSARPFRGKWNGNPFDSIADTDPSLGTRLEVFAAGAYLCIPFEQIASLRIEPPRLLRDTLWAPAAVRLKTGVTGMDLRQVLLPVIYPFSWKSEDESVWLGRMTAWTKDDTGWDFPVGQRMFLIDGEEVPLLEIRSLEFARDDIA